MRTLEFKDFADLKIKFNMIKQIHKTTANNVITFLSENDIPFNELSNEGITIDTSNVSQEHLDALKKIIEANEEFISYIYSQIGITGQDE